MTVHSECDQVVISAAPVSHHWLVRLQLDFYLGFLAFDVPHIHTPIYRCSGEEIFVFWIPGEGCDRSVVVSQNLLYFLSVEVIYVDGKSGTKSKTIA